tara:strand:+ start:3264 stop:3509 length:246 start_codon:yes stop_codon:yes gene_type:complete
MEEGSRQSEEFLPQLANIAESFNFLANNLKNIRIELELETNAYYKSVDELTNITKVISSDLDARYIIYIDNIKFTIIKINK